MNNVVTQVSKQGYVSRIGKSIKGIFTGFVLIIIGVGLLWWNEGRTVKQYQALTEVGGNVVSVPVDEVSPDNEGKLIHTKGLVKTDELLSDEIFAVVTPGLALERTVEMYQWEEEEKRDTNNNTGGSQTTTTTFTYNTIWSDESINSSEFTETNGHLNPPKNLRSSTETAKEATLGAFEFRANKINQLRSGYENLNLTPEQVALFPTEFGSTAVIKGDYVYNNDNNQPEVGDYRVRFSYLPNSTEASIIGQQDGESILAYTADSGNEILLIEPGLKTAEAMVESAQKSNSFMGWLIRGGGTLLVIIGISLILAPLAVLASVLPFLGSITGGITGGIAFVLGLFISLITIGMAWVFYRPVIGIALLLVAFASLALLFFVKKKGADPTVNEPTNVAPNQNSSVQTSPISAATPAQPTPVQNINPVPIAAVAPAGVTPVANTTVNPATAQNLTPQPTAANPFANPAAATPPVQTAPTSNSMPTPTTSVQNINAEPVATATPSGSTPITNTNLNPAPVQNSVPQPTAANPFASPVAATPPAATPTVETPTTPPPTSNPFA